MSTLIEELEQAAHAFSLLADKSDGDTRSECDTFAARLRARIEHVKRVQNSHAPGERDPECSICHAFDDLTGDLP